MNRGALFGIGAVAIWASYMVLAKQGVSAGLNGMDFAFLRFVTAGVVVLPWLLGRGVHDLAGVGWPRAIGLALTAGPLFILAGVGGFAHAPLAHGAVVQPATIVIASTALAAWVFGERPGTSRMIGIAVMVGGLAAIAGPSLWTGTHTVLLGDALFVTAGLLWSVFTVLTKRWRVPALPATAALSFVSMLAVTPAYLFTDGLPRLAALPFDVLLLQIVVQGVLSGVVAVLLFTRANELLGPSRAAVFPATVPAAAMLLGVPVLAAWPTAGQWAGLTLVSLGLLVAVFATRKAPASSR